MKELTIEIDKLLKKRFFFAPTAEIYNGLSGFFDYGPYGTLLKNNIISFWRKSFLNEENIYEIDTSIITPYEVLKASGHVDKFTDLLVFDKITGECYRADHFLEQELLKLDQTDEIKDIMLRIECLLPKDVDEVCEKFQLKSLKGNNMGDCKHFNLIFQTSVGPGSKNVSFLRPETAQGQFINFKKIYEINGNKLPFGSASIGKVFRNEISPRSGLLRVREFEQAEIEYYVHPKKKQTERFKEFSGLTMNLMFCVGDSIAQTVHKMQLKEAVAKGIINNELLGSFIGKTYQFLIDLGIDAERLRFRQHKKNEMAHYAADCWDAEINTTYGWIECVGIADRSCYDLMMHQKHANYNLSAIEAYETPVDVETFTFKFNYTELVPKLKANIKDFKNKLEGLSQSEIRKSLIESKPCSLDTLHNTEDCFSNSDNNQNCLADEACKLSLGNGKKTLDVIYNRETFKVEIETKVQKSYGIDFIPSVIEPSFGIGRILYSLIEHIYYNRENDKERTVLKFNPIVAPIFSVVTVLREGEEYNEIIKKIRKDYEAHDCKFKLCVRSCSIGKKYSSFDEIGVPYFITLDQQTIQDNTCTIRERDSMEQKRIDVSQIGCILKKLMQNTKHFNELK